MAILAPSLVALRAEVNARYTHRDKTSDGWIGDPAHQDRPSDHNPGDRGLVHALDIDEDIDGINDLAGAELAWLADYLRTKRDPRVKYVIYEARMFSSYAGPRGEPAWEWRPYTGVNPHATHLHVSILSTPLAEQDTRPWLPEEADDMPDEATFKKWTREAVAEQLDAEARRVRGITAYDQLQTEILDAARTAARQASIDTPATDPAAIAAAVLEQLDAEAIAAAIPDSIAADVADELAARLAG